MYYYCYYYILLYTIAVVTITIITILTVIYFTIMTIRAGAGLQLLDCRARACLEGVLFQTPVAQHIYIYIYIHTHMYTISLSLSIYIYTHSYVCVSVCHVALAGRATSTTEGVEQTSEQRLTTWPCIYMFICIPYIWRLDHVFIMLYIYIYIYTHTYIYI